MGYENEQGQRIAVEVPNAITERIYRMKKPHIAILCRILLCALCALLLCSLFACAKEDPETAPVERKTYQYWKTTLQGTQVTINDRPEHGEINPGGSHYFYGEIVQIEPDYLVVSPRADIPEDSSISFPSHTPELAALSDRYIVPCAWMREGQESYFETDEIAVGQQMRIHFNTTTIYQTEEYGDALVIKDSLGYHPIP